MKTAKTRTFLTRLVAILAILLVLVVVWKVISSDGNDELSSTQSTNSKPQTKTTNNDKSNDVQTSTGSGVYQTRNAARKNDASRLASSIMQFASDNRGKYPTDYVEGTLSGNGYSQPGVELDHYKTATILSGAQPALESDILVAVTNAECGEGGAVLARGTGSRDFVIQYMQEAADGALIPSCMTT